MLVDVEVWERNDEIVVTSDSSRTLDNFLNYRERRLYPRIPHDNAQLLTLVVTLFTLLKLVCTLNVGIPVIDRQYITVNKFAYCTFSNIVFAKGVIGKAHKHVMCTLTKSGGVNHVGYYSLSHKIL